MLIETSFAHTYSFTNILFILDVAQKAFSSSVTLSLPTQVKPQNDGATEPADQLLSVPNAPLALRLHIFYGTYPPPFLLFMPSLDTPGGRARETHFCIAQDLVHIRCAINVHAVVQQVPQTP